MTDEVEFTAPETFGTAVITFGTWKQVSADRLLVGEGAAAVQIQIDAGGLPVKIEATTIDEDVRGAEKPTRIGIDLADPVLTGRDSPDHTACEVVPDQSRNPSCGIQLTAPPPATQSPPQSKFQ